MSKILVVDDDRVIGLLVGHQLRSAGHEVIEATDVASAVAAWDHHVVDLVLCDLRLPDASGLDLWSRLAELSADGRPTVPFVLMTGVERREDLGDERAESVDAYLTKPVATSDLLAAIDELTSASALTPTPTAAVAT